MTTLPSNNHYNKNLKSYARQHRTNGTKAEIRMWKHVLSRKQLLNCQFLRQRPIDRFIADFFCKEVKLVIEVDGYSHQWEETYRKDKEKDHRLNELGYEVLRFTDEEVFKDIGRVRETIGKKIEELKSRHPPFPLPFPQSTRKGVAT